jgi:hypothetical protein
MARRVFVHIGTMKSGTSYVQALFDANRAKVVEQGLLWTAAADCFLATDDLLGTRRIRPGLEGAWARLEEQLTGHPGDALISNELLAVVNSRKRARLVDALQPSDVRIIITARDLGRVIPSQWQTGARNRDTVGWSDYVQAICGNADDDAAAGFWRRQDVPEIIRRWSRQVPVGNITVVLVPPSGVGPELTGERFGSVVGIDTSGFTAPNDGNPSVGGYSAELLRRINERTASLDWVHYRWAFKNGLARLVLAERAAQEPSIKLTPDQLRLIGRRSASMIDQLASSGVRIVGDLSDLTPSIGTVERVEDPGNATAEQLLETAIDGLIGLGGLLADARIEHEAVVRQFDELYPEAEGDRDAFVAYEEALPDPPNPHMVASRYLRWRVERRAGDGSRGVGD